MGLTHSSTGIGASESRKMKKRDASFTVAIAGNPNVGKSTIFNALTGMNQHTGNWPGKTTGYATGYFRIGGEVCEIIDVPGTYSLRTRSQEEEIAREMLVSDKVDAVIIVCDATCLERNLVLALQIIELGKPALICINLLDEARRRGVRIDVELLQKRLGVPIIGAVARRRGGLDELKEAIDELLRNRATKKAADDQTASASDNADGNADDYVKRAEEICNQAYFIDREKGDRCDRRLDKLFTGRKTAYPIMLVLLLFVFWLTISGANYPSKLLSQALFYAGDRLGELLLLINTPIWLHSLLIDGVYRVLAWIVSVMLPPMAIFFPLFTLLEDSGYLPRIAFNLDKPFQKCKTCGKQALTMCMGFGCNAAGVVGCRIIDSSRERKIAMLTNSFVPCNGRFPLLISILTIFIVGGATGFFGSVLSALILTAIILVGISMTFLTSRFLSSTIFKGEPTPFILELPPYRRPQIGKVIVRSVLDRTIFVLGRAVISAIPAGIIIWLMVNLQIGGNTLLSTCAGFLDPFARILGLDGVILIAFILGFPANEIVIPIMLMAYCSTGVISDASSLAELKNILIVNGWTVKTAICTMLFSLMHWPCSTTLLTIKKESGSLRLTLLTVAIPTVCGILLCVTVNALFLLFGA